MRLLCLKKQFKSKHFNSRLFSRILIGMSDAWEEIQAVKTKRNELRERLQKRRKEREDLLGGAADPNNSSSKLESTIRSAGCILCLILK